MKVGSWEDLYQNAAETATFPFPVKIPLAQRGISLHNIPMSNPTYFVVSREQHEALVSAAYQHRGYLQEEAAAAAHSQRAESAPSR